MYDITMKKTGIITITVIIVIIAAITLLQNPVQNAPSIDDSPEIKEQVTIISEKDIVESPEISDSATVSSEDIEVITNEDDGLVINIKVGDTPKPKEG